MSIADAGLSRWLNREGYSLLDDAAATAQRFGHRHFRAPHILLSAVDVGMLDETLLRAEVERDELIAGLTPIARRAATSWSGEVNEADIDSSLERTLIVRARRMARELESQDILDAIIIDQVGITTREIADLGALWSAVRNGWMPAFRMKADVMTQAVADDALVLTPTVARTHTDVLARYCSDYGAARNRTRDLGLVLPVSTCTRLAGVLGRLTRRSALIVGDAGVGKTSLVRAFSAWIETAAAPDWLRGTSMLTVSCHALAAGVGHRGELDDRTQRLIDAGIANPNLVLFFDELEVLAEAVGSSGQGPLGLFHEHLSAGTLRIIAAAQTAGFEAHLRKHDSLLRRFEVIYLKEPPKHEVLTMMRNRLADLQAHYGARADESVLEAVISNCERYMPSRRFPDKAMTTLDAAFQRHRERRAADPHRGEHVTTEMVLEVMSEETRIPVARLGEMEHARLEGLAQYLTERVFDQAVATQTIALGIQRLRLGLKDQKRTGGAFLCVGPPGTGKTEMAKALAEYLMGSETAMIRFNMSEFQTPESYQRLVGAPPGYVGFDAGGELTNGLMENPYSVVLLDEIEKGASRVFDVLLQVLSDGHLMDSHGRTVDCKNSVFIMTSNAIADARDLGDRAIRQALLAYRDPHRPYESGPTFRREFIDRLDIIPFASLSASTLQRIAAREVAKVLEQAENGDIIACSVAAGPDIMSWLVNQIDAETTGARAVQRLVESTVARTIAQGFLSGKLERGLQYELILDDKESLALVRRIVGTQGDAHG